MTRVPAFRGEFGIKVYAHVPQVYALCQDHAAVVEIEEGEEALYPAAEKWKVVGRAHDDTRHGGPGSVYGKKQRFVPTPHEKQDIPPVDVVVCPRWRRYGSAKNWEAWPALTDMLQARGLDVFAAGAPDSSYEVDAPKAWEYERFLDATLEAFHAADLVVATDAGLAHLAVLCGRPLLLVTYEGRVAPGPVVDSGGRVMGDRYWPVKMHRYREANHMDAPIETVDGWEDVKRVADRAEEILRAGRAA